MTLWVTVWWVWLAAAIIFAIAEILVPGFLFLGFALGALAVSLLLLNTGMTLSLPVLLFLFAGLSLIAWIVLRMFFKVPRGQVKHFDHDIND